MTADPDSRPSAEVSVCLNCTLPIEECDGGDPDCPWGQEYWYKPDREHRRAYIREYRKRNRQRVNEYERRRQRRRREQRGSQSPV